LTSNAVAPEASPAETAEALAAAEAMPPADRAAITGEAKKA
jgi:hypothetical protein